MSARSRASTSRTSAGRRAPAHCHSTVRSLSSVRKVTPWSMPYTCPSGVGSRCPALAVCVVDHRVEHRDVPQPLEGRAGHQPGDVDAVVDVDPELHHADAGLTVAVHVGGSSPTRGRGHLVRGDLALGQRAVGEVPERPFAGDRLVDARR